MVSEVVRQNGYSTAWFGKNHNVPDWETSISGPFDRWPTMQGFDRFYGFVAGEANQWAPALYDGATPVEMEVPKGREDNYTLNEHLADKAIDYVRRQSRSHRTGRSSSTTRRGRPTPHTTSPGRGWRSSGASSTRAGTRSARRSIWVRIQ